MSDTIPVVCSSCQKKMLAKAKHAGRTFKCPACGEHVKVPSGGRDNDNPAVRAGQTSTQAQESKVWHIHTEAGGQQGPFTKTQLASLVKSGQIDSETQILKDGWEDWKWAAELFPQLAPADPEPSEPENPFDFSAIDSGASSSSGYSSSSDASGSGSYSSQAAARRTSSGVPGWVWRVGAGVLAVIVIFGMKLAVKSSDDADVRQAAVERYSQLGLATRQEVQSLVDRHHSSCFDQSYRLGGRRQSNKFDVDKYLTLMDQRILPELQRLSSRRR